VAKDALDQELDAQYAAMQQPESAVTQVDPLDAELDSMYREEKYGTLGQQSITAAEGLLSGVVSSPVANLIETKVLGVDPADIRGRAEENPTISTVSEISGLVGSSFVPGGQGALLAKAGAGAAKALGAVEKASFLSKVGATATRTAFEGGLYQAGKELGDMVIADPAVGADFSLADVGLSFALGGVFGGAAGAAAEGFKKAAIEAAPFLKNVQESAGVRALGFTKGQVKKLQGGADEAKDIARTLMDAEIETGERIITPFASSDDIAAKVEVFRKEAGAKMEKVYNALDEKGADGIKPLELASKIDEKLGNFWRSPINKGEANQLENILESVMIRGDESISFKDAQLLKEEIKKVAYPGGRAPLDPSPKVQIAQEAYRIVRDEIDTAVEKAAGGNGLLGELRSARSSYAAAKKAGRAIADKVAGEQGNRLFGLTDNIIAGGALASGDVLGAGGAALVMKKLADRYGATMLSSSKDAYLDSLSKFTATFGNQEAINASKLAQATVNGYKLAQRATKSVFDKTQEMPAKVIPILSARDKLDKLVTENIKDPSRLLAMNDNNPVLEYNGPYAATSARAVAYLSQLKPKTEPTNPLDSKRVPSKSEQATYNRALGIAQQPLVTLKYIQDGTLTRQDMQALQTIYPSLHAQLVNQVTQQMVNTLARGKSIPYSTRKSLSTFIGQPLDSTLTPQSIQAAQPVSEQPQQQPQQGGQSKPPSASSMKGLEKGVSANRTPSQARGLEQSQGK
jgi:hypothetical protein